MSPPAAPWRTRLDNGLTVILAEHRAADVAAVQLWLGVGAAHETDGEAGLSHFIEHLLFKGTPTRGPGVIDRAISALGGEINAATSHDFTYYHIVLPAPHLDTALELVADVARHAALDAGEIDRERLVVLEEIRRAHDSPSGYLWRFLARQHFPDHPYGRPVLGTPEVIRGVGREGIVDYYRRHYAPNRAALVVAGSIDGDAAFARIQGAFSAWRPGPAAPDTGPIAGEPASVRRAEEGRPLRQAYLAVAWRGPTAPAADVYAVDVLTSILGRGRSSRLHQGLKERQGLVSSVGASFYPQRHAGTITVTARTSAEHQPEVERALLGEIDQLRQTLVSEAELARALTVVEAAHAFEHETAEGAAYGYGLAETLWTLDFELGYLDRVRGVTREQVREAARRYLVPERFTAAALTPTDGQP